MKRFFANLPGKFLPDPLDPPEGSRQPSIIDGACLYTVGAIKAPQTSVERAGAVGVFWDLENCGVPRGANSAMVARAIIDRARQFGSTVRCKAAADTANFKRDTIATLSNMGISIIDVGATKKGSDRADFELVHSMSAPAPLASPKAIPAKHAPRCRSTPRYPRRYAFRTSKAQRGAKHERAAVSARTQTSSPAGLSFLSTALQPIVPFAIVKYRVCHIVAGFPDTSSWKLTSLLRP